MTTNRTVTKERDRLIHILVVHFDMFRDKAEAAADLFLHDKNIASADWPEKAIATAIFDPGAFVGMKGERTLTEWQVDAVMTALRAASIPPAAQQEEAVAWASCPGCNGTGDQGGNPSYGVCDDCGGTGKVAAPQPWSEDMPRSSFPPAPLHQRLAKAAAAPASHKDGEAGK